MMIVTPYLIVCLMMLATTMNYVANKKQHCDLYNTAHHSIPTYTPAWLHGICLILVQTIYLSLHTV